MARAVVVVLVGAIAGSLATTLVSDLETAADRPAARAVLEPLVDDDLELVVAPDYFSLTLETAEIQSRFVGVVAIEDELRRVAGAPASLTREVEIAALVERLAEADPLAAVALAQRADLDTQHVDQLFRDWAADEPDAALRGLLLLELNSTRRSAALALLDVFGHSDAATQRIAAMFAPVESRAFTVDALAQRAERDLGGAIDAALAFKGWNFVPLSRIADVAARLDPELGIESSSSIPVAMMRRRYRDRLMDEWAKLDPHGMLDWLETADLSEETQAIFSFQAAAAAAPERLLAIAERMGPNQATIVRRAAIRELTLLDPVAAYETVRSLPPNADIDTLVGTIATQFAERSPREALAWVESLEPRSQVALNAVLATVAAADPLLAANAVIAEIVDPFAAIRGEMPQLMSVAVRALEKRLPELVQIVDIVASHPDSRVRSQLDDLVARWAALDPASAAGWAARRGASLSAESMLTLATQISAHDSALAMRTLAQVPQDRRGPWVAGIAGGIASEDLAGALAFAERYRAEPVYAAAVANALHRSTSSQPVAVARYIDAEKPAQSGTLAQSVASSWARRDPLAAAQWVIGLTDIEERARANAIGSVVAAWAARDARAARGWVLDLGSGAARDAAVNGLLLTIAVTGNLDAELLAAYSSAAMRAEAIIAAMPTLARSDPGLGRSLIERYVDDPAQRQRAEARLDQAAERPPAIVLPSGDSFILR